MKKLKSCSFAAHDLYPRRRTIRASNFLSKRQEEFKVALEPPMFGRVYHSLIVPHGTFSNSARLSLSLSLSLIRVVAVCRLGDQRGRGAIYVGLAPE